MNKWQETVKRVAKQHPGKSLKEILPLAKLEYKKMGHSSSGPTKKHKKHHKKHHKKSHAHKKTRGRKGGRGSRRMRGGGQSCASSSGLENNPLENSASNVVNDWDGSWAPQHASVGLLAENDQSLLLDQSGGSHCGTHHRRRARKGPTRKRRPKRRRMRGGDGGCAAALNTDATDLADLS